MPKKAPADPNALPVFKLKIVDPEKDVPTRCIADGKHPSLGRVVLTLGMVSVLGCLKPDGTVTGWQGGNFQAPGLPSRPMGLEELIGAIQKANAVNPDHQSDVMKGKWVGVLTCEVGPSGHQPVVILERAIASYVRIRLIARVTGWSWQVIRSQQWYAAEAKIESTTTAPTLMDALSGALPNAMNLIQQACGFRDSTRRSAADLAYAEKHPFHPTPAPAFDPSNIQPPAPPKPPKQPAAPRVKKAPEIPAVFVSMVRWDERGYWILTAAGWQLADSALAPTGKPSQKALRALVTAAWNQYGQPAGVSLPAAYKPAPPPSRKKKEAAPTAPAIQPQATPAPPAPAPAPSGDAATDQLVLGAVEAVLQRTLAGVLGG